MFKKITLFWARHELLVAIIAAAIGALFPIIIRNEYYITVGIYICLYAILSLSVNLITGYTGIVVLGQAAFYCVGAYTSAILAQRFHMDFMLTLPIAVILSFMAGIIIGLPTLRMTGRYLSIVTLGFGEIVRIIAHNWDAVTGGPFGLKDIPPHTVFGFTLTTRTQRYYLIFILMVIVALLIYNLNNSRVGRVMASVKGDEMAAQSMGINLYKYKVLIFATSSAIAGVAGAFFPHFVGYIDAASFSADISMNVLGMTILGGLGSISGSVLGSIIYNIIPELLRSLEQHRMIIYGAILVIMIIFRPNGILGGINLKQIRLFHGREKAKEAEAKAASGKENADG